jgi:glycosyltransferase involved in cell wall biosynthesis
MISVIIPFHNEKENLPILVPHLQKVLSGLKTGYEIVLVDDGSTDAFGDEVMGLIDGKETVLHKMGRQMGKGRALRSGISLSKGDIIVFMDADLQDNPDDLPAFYEELSKGYDLVNGHRHNRKDVTLIKIYSKPIETLQRVCYSEV